jgi:hypothetical protein
MDPGSGPGAIGTFFVPETVFATSDTRFRVDLGASGASDLLDLNDNASLFLTSGMTIDVAGFRDSQTRDYIIGTVSGTGDIQLNFSTAPTMLGELVVGGANTGPVLLSAPGFAAGDRFTLTRSGGNLVLTYTPVPEPVAVLAVFMAGVGVAGYVRRRAGAAPQ